VFVDSYHCANSCKVYLKRVKAWAGAVFAGKVIFNPALERDYREQGGLLLSAAEIYLAGGSKGERATLEELRAFLDGWETPRRGQSSSEVEAIRRRVLGRTPPGDALWDN
jgi:hypothetical protein